MQMINSRLAISQGEGGGGGGGLDIKTYVGHEQFKKVKKTNKKRVLQTKQ